MKIEIGFISSLTLIFITLKLLGKINWSWWWVLSPLWISLGIGVFFLMFILILLWVIS
jgi:membrane protein YdbS with pleckstrin-like domain